MHFPHGVDVAALWVIGKLVAIDLVVTIVSMAVDDDVNVSEIGVAARLELHRLGSSNRVERPARFGFGQRKPLAGLLNVNAQLLGYVVQGRSDPRARNPVGNSDADNDHD